MLILSLSVAGALGALARYFFSIGVARWIGLGFPVATLGVNVVGSFLLGFVANYSLSRFEDADFRVVAGTGFLGAFTTFSTFELETQRLLEQKAYTGAFLYVSGNLILGFAAVMAGRALAARLS